MSHFEIIYLFFRTIELPGDEKKPQFQIFFKTDETMPFKEENSRTLIKVKAVPQTQLSFQLILHKANDVVIVNNSITVKEMNLTPFEPKTLCLPFTAENGERIFFIFDAFSYYIPPEDSSASGAPILLDFSLKNLVNREYLIEKVEKQMKRAKAIGFSMIEYELVFQFMKQTYNFKFFSNEKTFNGGQNVFVTNNPELGNMSIKLLAHEYEWFVEGQSKTLRATKTLAESSFAVQSLIQEDQIKVNSQKILGEFGIEFSVSTRESAFLKNFIGHLDFRVLSASFLRDKIENPTIVLKQLGSNIQWTLEPYSMRRSKEYIFDYEFEKILKEFKAPESVKVKTSFKDVIVGLSGNGIESIETPVDPEVQNRLDLLYQVEDDENNLERETLNIAYQKNGAYFYSNVPNDTIVLEVYSNRILLGFAFFPLANINLDQNYCEKIVPFNFSQRPEYLGEVVVRVQYSPLNIGVNQDIFSNLESLDFDDISERFDTTAKFYEACLLMDHNIEKAKNLIWPKRINNYFSDLSSDRKFVLNLADIQNLGGLFSKETILKDLEVRVRISDQHQIIKLGYSQFKLRDLKTSSPKEYFLLTEASYNQVLIQEEGHSTIIFRLKDSKEDLGALTLQKIPNYHHFEFTVQHPKESCSLSLYSQGKPLDFKIFSLDTLPLANEVDSLLLPFQVPLKSNKNAPENGTLFLKFETMVFPEEEVENVYSSGVFVLQRIRTQNSVIGQADLKAKYDLEIQTPQGLVHKIINLGNEISIDRTQFEHLTEIRKEDDTQIKLILRKIVKDPVTNDYEEASQMPVLFENQFTLKGGDAVDNSDFQVICLKPNSGTERKIEVKDGTQKGAQTTLSLNFRFRYQVNKFIDFPEGVLNIRLISSDIETLKEKTPFKNVNNLKIYLSDVNSEIKESPSYIFLERSFEDTMNQPKIQTYDWTNKLVIEAYDSGDNLQGRAFLHLNEIPLGLQEEAIKQVTLGGVRVNFVFLYTPLLSDEVQDVFSLKSTKDQAGKKGDAQNGATRKALGMAENLKQRIKDLENDNLVLRTNVNKVNAVYQKKMRAIDKLQAFNSNYQEAQKSASQPKSDDEPLHKSKYSKEKVSQLKELFNKICQCGKPAPKFKGYCGDCLLKLKQEYEKCLADYMPIAENYESLATKNHNFWKKKSALEKKIQSYERKAKEFNFDFINEEEEMLKDEAKNLKAKLIDRKNEIDIMQQEHYFKIEEMKAKQKLLEELLQKKTYKLDKLLKRTQEEN